MSWTTAAHLTDSWIGADAPTNTDLIDMWLGKAEREIRYRVPDIQARIDAEMEEIPGRTDLLEAARDVTVAMVTRVFRNPDGVRQANETTGPFTKSVTYGGDIPGGLTLTDDELARLQGQQSDAAFTIDMIPSTSPFASGAVVHVDAWLSDV